jgi:hypothetical protein
MHIYLVSGRELVSLEYIEIATMWVTLRLIDAGVKSYICNYIPKKMALLLTDCVVF